MVAGEDKRERVGEVVALALRELERYVAHNPSSVRASATAGRSQIGGSPFVKIPTSKYQGERAESVRTSRLGRQHRPMNNGPRS